jgi:outer membrane protein
MRKRTLFFGIMLFTASKGYCEEHPQPINLSLAAAIEMGVSRNLDLRGEAFNAEMTRTDLARSRGIYNPVFTLSGNGGVTAIPGDPFFSTKSATGIISLMQNLPTGGSITASTQAGYTDVNIDVSGTLTKNWQSSAGLTLTLPLLKNAGIQTTELNILVSANALQDSFERFNGAIIDTVSSVITSYSHLYVLRHIQESRESVLKSAQSLLDEIKQKANPTPLLPSESAKDESVLEPRHKRKENPDLLAMELANAEFAIAQRRKDFIEAIRNVRDQEESLRYLIGMVEKRTVIPVDPPSREEPTETTEQAVKAALEMRPDLKLLKQSLKTNQLQERVSKHQTWPELNLTASGGATSTGVNIGDSFHELGSHPGNYWNAGMLFTYPIGNYAAKNDYLKNKIKTQQIENQISSLTWKIQNDVESDLRALISARLQLQLADKAKQIAEQRHEEYLKNNRLGTATVQDVLNAGNDQSTARNAQLEAAETFANAVAKLWKDTGLLLERHSIHIDTSRPEKFTENKGPIPSQQPPVKQ